MNIVEDKKEYLILTESNLKNIKEIPKGIKYLYVSNNQLTKLPKLPDSLEILDVSNNQLTKLPKLPDSLYFLDFSFNNLSSFPKIKNDIYFRAENNPISQNLYNIKKLNNISKEYFNGKEYFTCILRKGTVLFHNMSFLDNIFEMYIGDKKGKNWSVSPDHQTYFFLHPFNISYGSVTTINVLIKDVKILYLLEPSNIMKFNDEDFISFHNCKKEKRFACIKDEIKNKNILGWIGHDTRQKKGEIWHGENKNFLKYYSYVSYYKNSDNVIDRPEVSLYPFSKVHNDYIYFEDEDIFGIKDNGKIWLENNENLFNYKTIAIIENNEDFKEYKKVIDSLLSKNGLYGYNMKRNEEDGLYYIKF